VLTDAHCRAAKPKEQLYRLNDLRGLYLEVKPNGVKAWRYRFKLGGKGSWFALGDYPAVSLAEARDKCEEARKLVKQGINPVQNRQLERFKREQDSANTFEAVAKEWLALKDWEDITKKRRLDMLERVVFPSIGKLPVRDITPAHILAILTKGFAAQRSLAIHHVRHLRAGGSHLAGRQRSRLARPQGATC
jgi:hypothetical protein